MINSASALSWSPVWWNNSNGNPNGVWQLGQMVAENDFQLMTWNGNGWWQGVNRHGSGHPIASTDQGKLWISYISNSPGYWSTLSFVAPVSGRYSISGMVGQVANDQHLDVIVYKNISGTFSQTAMASFYNLSTGDKNFTLSGTNPQLTTDDASFLDGVSLNAGDFIVFRPWTGEGNAGYAFGATMDGVTISLLPWSPAWWDNTAGNPNGVWQLGQMVAENDFQAMTWNYNGWWQGTSLHGSGHPIASTDSQGKLWISYLSSSPGYWSTLSFVAPNSGTYSISGMVGQVSNDQHLDVTVYKNSNGTFSRTAMAGFYNLSTDDKNLTLSSTNPQLTAGNASFLDGLSLNAGDFIVFRPWTGEANAGVAFGATMGDIAISLSTPNYSGRPEMISYSQSITVDGMLSDWADAEWAPLDQKYDGNGASDVSQAFFAAKWGDQGNKVYVAVKVQDLHHSLTDTCGMWNARDAIEVYLHTTGSGNVNYYVNQDVAQQYILGIKTSNQNQVWMSLSDKGFVPSTAGFEAAGKVDGEWLYYEMAMTPFEYFGGITGQPNIISTLTAGSVIGLDVCVVSHDGTQYAGMKSENMMKSKSSNWQRFGLHKIAAAPALRPGDANGDRMVDVGDLGILAANYGGSGKSWAQGDFNGDKLVDVGDLGILAAHYGEGSGTSQNFSADYAKVFGTTVTDDDEDTSMLGSSVCSGLGLPLVAGILLMGLMLVKFEE
jgi:hypothetical protein